MYVYVDVFVAGYCCVGMYSVTSCFTDEQARLRSPLPGADEFLSL